MEPIQLRRNTKWIGFLQRTLWPLMRACFRMRCTGLNTLPSEGGPWLFVGNHNIGAILESHSSLFWLRERFPEQDAYGFTHPAIFRVPGVNEHFVAIGAIPSSYEAAQAVFDSGAWLMIFPGGNRQALRSIWRYKENVFPWTHGWARIAIKHRVSVVPITFRGSHFVNPVLFTSRRLATLLVLPRLVGIKWMSASLAQLLSATLMSVLAMRMGAPIWLTGLLAILAFCFSPLIPLLPWTVRAHFHHPIHPDELIGNDEATRTADLEGRVGRIMDSIYSDVGHDAELTAEGRLK